MKMIINGMFYGKILTRKMYNFKVIFMQTCVHGQISSYAKGEFILIFVINLTNPQYRSITFLKIYCIDLIEKY